MVEIFRERQNFSGGGRGHGATASLGEAVQGLRQLRGRRGAWAVRGTGTGDRRHPLLGRGLLHTASVTHAGSQKCRGPGVTNR